MRNRSASLRLAALLAGPALAAFAAPAPASAEVLRVTCDNFIEEIFVDGAAVTPLGPNSNMWPTPDSYTLSLAPGPHTIAVRCRDDNSTIAGLMVVLFADDGTTPVARTGPTPMRTVSTNPGAGWGAPGFDDSSWPVAGTCPNPGPWGSSLDWGRMHGAEMVWGPSTCAGAELGTTRWFRWGVNVPCTGAADCSDGNECTTDACSVGVCSNTPRALGDPCTGGACGGPSAPMCLACVDTSATGTDAGCLAARPHCRTSGAGAPVCEACLDTATGSGTDLGCVAATPYCVAGAGGNACVACVSAADCNDDNECTTDSCSAAGACVNTTRAAGSTCSGGVCDGAASPACVPCIDTGAGTDPGCTAGRPFCTGTGAGATCAACTTAAHCNDANDCTADACIGGSCFRTPLPAGDPCAGGVCSGAGAMCVECVADAQCPGARPRCDVATNVCVQCLGTGDCADGLECTADLCTAGVCSNPLRPAGDPCTGGVCAGDAASCVQCLDDSHCAGSTRCDPSMRVCVGCLVASDCEDGNECTSHACSAGSCSTTPVAPGTLCAAGICDVNAVCSTVAVAITAPMEAQVVTTPTPTIRGTATPGETVTVSIDGVVVGTAVAAADGTWTLPLTTPLADGPHMATATVTTAAGSATSTVTFTVDATTTVTITEPADGSTTMDATPDIAGTGEPGATVVVTVDGVEVGTATVGADGRWVVRTSTPLSNGAHTAVATATDASGNTASATSTFTVDATTTVAITAPANGSTTSDTMPTIRGTAAPGATVVVTVDGVEVGTVTADAAGHWEVPLTAPLADGEHRAEATATDAAGNMATDTSTFTVDTMTFVTVESADASGVITGTGEPGATVVVTLDGEEVGTVTVAPDGTWRLDTGRPLAPGEHTVTATATDPTGNTATDTLVVVITPAPDGGVADAGVIGDGGVADAAVPGLDAGGDVPPTGGGLTGGALCSAGHGRAPAAPLALVLAALGLALWRRRR
ncbi:MAG: hypothetical protein KF729_15370 [Sandaracinaceae bacterium]|nr:hypothetical protein [Sandaracinaceae bacterium]